MPEKKKKKKFTDSNNASPNRKSKSNLTVIPEKKLIISQ